MKIAVCLQRRCLYSIFNPVGLLQFLAEGVVGGAGVVEEELSVV